MDYNEKRKKDKLNKSVATSIAVRRMNEKSYMEYRRSQRSPSSSEISTRKEDMELGKQAYDAGIRHTDEELQNERYFFAIGYKVAERIDYARQIDERKNMANFVETNEESENIVKRHR